MLAKKNNTDKLTPVIGFIPNDNEPSRIDAIQNATTPLIESETLKAG